MVSSGFRVKRGLWKPSVRLRFSLLFSDSKCRSLLLEWSLALQSIARFITRLSGILGEQSLIF